MATKKSVNYSKPLLTIFTIIVVVIFGIFAIEISKSNTSKSSKDIPLVQDTSFDFSNRKVMLDNQELTFINGSFTSADKEHAATITNRNVNPSGTHAAAIFVDTSEGSGSFYYLVGGMLKEGNETYSDPQLLGDRIKITSLKVDDPGADDQGLITIEYLDRAVGAPMSEEPTMEMTTKYSFEDNGNLIEVLH